MVGFIWRENVCVCVCGEWGVGGFFLSFLFFSLLFTNKQRASNIVVAFAFMIQRYGDQVYRRFQGFL